MYITALLAVFLFSVQTFSYAKNSDPIKKMPAQISAIPESVRGELEKVGCVVPQSYIPNVHFGWARGHFSSPDQIDWAVLCSDTNGKSKIRVVWGGKEHPCPSSLQELEDKIFMQTIGQGKMGYSRSLSTANSKRILDHLGTRKIGAHEKPFLDGIEDVYIDKGSEIFICQSGKWKSVVGSD